MTNATWHDYLFVGTHGHVTALEKATGERLWTTSLPRGGYGVVSLLVEDDFLFCASGGRVYALDPGTGEIVWKNGLSGLGLGPVFLTTALSNNTQEVLAIIEQQRQNTQHHAGS